MAHTPQLLTWEQAIILDFHLDQFKDQGGWLSTADILKVFLATSPYANSGKVIDTLYQMEEDGILIRDTSRGQRKWTLAPQYWLFKPGARLSKREIDDATRKVVELTQDL